MQTHLLKLASGLDSQKYDITVIAPESSLLQSKLSELSIPLITLDIDDRLRPLKDWLTARRLRRLLRELRPDILHIHGNKSALVGRLAARRLHTPVVLVTVHNFLIYQEASAIMRLPAVWMERWLARYTDRLITVSASLRRSLIDIEGIAPGKIVTIPNGIDVLEWKDNVDPVNARHKMGFSTDDFLIASAGRLVPMKGYIVLLRAAALITKERPEIKIAIAGEGPLKDELLAEAEKLGLKGNVFFLGFLPDTKELLAAADLFVLPSLKEPFGIAILEAMAAGVPVVATNAGGVPEIIKGETGVVVPPGDVEELAQAILGLVDDEPRRQRLTVNAARLVDDEFSVAEMVRRTDNLYQDLLADKRRKG